MQAIFEYLSVGDLFALVGIGIMVAVLAANCSYQKHRALARERTAPEVARTPERTTAVSGVVAQV